MVGLLEEVPGVSDGEKSHFGVRVALEKEPGGWRALPFQCANEKCLAALTAQYPRETRWTVSSNGRILGTVLARTPAQFGFYAHIGIQDLADGEKAPRLGRKSMEYSGFLGSPVQRPLLTTAGAPKLAPAHGGWKLSAVDPRDVERVWPSFRRVAPLIDDCRLGSHIRAPKRAEFEIATAWTNRVGDALLYARVSPDVSKECDGPRSSRSAYWYYRRSGGAVWLLPGQDISPDLVMPLDFVDILGDGNDEALFLMAGYNAGGYALFYDRFRRVSTFQWTYH